MAAAVDRAQGGVEVLLELGEFAVDVDVAFAAQPVSLGVRRVDQPGGLGVGRLHDFGLRNETLLFFDAFLHGFLVGDVAVFDEPVGFRLGTAGGRLVFAFCRRTDANGFFACLGDHSFTVLARLTDHPVGLGLGVGQNPVGFRASVVDQRIRL